MTSNPGVAFVARILAAEYRTAQRRQGVEDGVAVTSPVYQTCIPEYSGVLAGHCHGDSGAAGEFAGSGALSNGAEDTRAGWTNERG